MSDERPATWSWFWPPRFLLLVLAALHCAVAAWAESPSVATTNLFFKPVHYRPLPQKTAGLKHNCLLLDGEWWINVGRSNRAGAPGESRRLELAGKDAGAAGGSWSPFRVPGQSLQQGYDIPRERPVAVATEFTIPAEWAGRRLVLRFDAIHAGTCYRLNGRELGYSENLFTPVEWDITEAARVGEVNQLDLEMKVATVSEALSHSCDYAFHNLGGIDRSVRLFALPSTHLRRLRLDAGLDTVCRDGELRIEAELEGGGERAADLSLAVALSSPNGRAVRHSTPVINIGPFRGTKVVEFGSTIANPLKWSAEKPNLYRLGLELRQGKRVLERVERCIGFRKIEIRGSQVLFNGQRLKLAGVCHHEYDPLGGRAGTARHAETDVRLLQEANLNYIRTSHYPPTEELLEAADRLGMYVEVEAPFCWVGGALDNATNLPAMLTPVSAMIDYCHSHPSVIVWSLGNESQFNRQFLAEARLCKELDPTRPTTFNHDTAASLTARVTDIANLHYPPIPYGAVFPGDPRPVLFGEYFFPVCHEQTDVRIDPGLRELWGHGHAEPDSEFGRACATQFAKPPLKPGLLPGGWSLIRHSDRLLGGAIWASQDDAFYFADGKTAGYAWHHGFWGLIDPWRRPKPEWELARHIFSPVWLETRHVPYTTGQKSVRVPVENRYAFTDFSELNFSWELGGHKSRLKPRLAPGARGELEIPLAAGTAEGDALRLRATTGSGRVVHESLVWLEGERGLSVSRPTGPQGPPQPQSSARGPRWWAEGGKVVIRGNGFGAVFDREKGDFDLADTRHTCAVRSFPTLHVTRYDFGDLNGPNSPPYAVFPDARTRRFERLEVEEEGPGLRLTVHDRYDGFAGSISWLLDGDGRGKVSCDYVYSGQPMDTRETGIRLLLDPGCDELKWRRWSEWGVFPRDSICRTEGTARAHRAAKWGQARWNERPAWPWSLDETELGTADFRSVKFNIYWASLVSPRGRGVGINAAADAHFRAALAPGGVAAHVLSRCPLGQVRLNPGDKITGRFAVSILP